MIRGVDPGGAPLWPPGAARPLAAPGDEARPLADAYAPGEAAPGRGGALAWAGDDPFGGRDQPAAKAARSRAAAQGHGHVGGLLAGKLGSNKFVAEYAIDSRAKCRDAKCAAFIAQGDLRIGKIPPSLNSVHGRTHWYHARGPRLSLDGSRPVPETRRSQVPCIFRSFTRACRGTKTITCVDDIANFAFLKPDDRYRIQVAVQLSRRSRYRAPSPPPPGALAPPHLWGPHAWTPPVGAYLTPPPSPSPPPSPAAPAAAPRRAAPPAPVVAALPPPSPPAPVPRVAAPLAKRPALAPPPAQPPAKKKAAAADPPPPVRALAPRPAARDGGAPECPEWAAGASPAVADLAAKAFAAARAAAAEAPAAAEKKDDAPSEASDDASLDDDVLKGAVGELAAINRDGPRASFQVPPDWRGASIGDWKPPGAVCDVSFRGRVRRGVVEAYTVCEAIVKLDKVAALLPLSLARDAGRVSWVDDA